MAGPNKTLTTLRPGLGASMEAYDRAASRLGFIGPVLFPYFDVPVAADKFGKATLASLLQDYDDTRASGSGYTRSDFDFEDDMYATKEYGHEAVVDERNARLYADYFDLEVEAAERSRDVVMRKQELRVAQKLHDETTFTPDPVTNEWNDFTAATPILDVEGAVRVLRDRGIKANCLQIGWETFRNLGLCDEVLEKVASFGAGQSILPADIGIPELQRAFKLEHIVVGDAQRNSAGKGLAANLEEIWSDEYAVVTRLPSRKSIIEPCLGWTFHWGGDGSVPGGAFEEYWENGVRSGIIRCRHEVDIKLMYEEAVVLLSNIKDPGIVL